MIVTTPPRLKSFCERFSRALSEPKRAGLVRLLAGHLLATGKRTQSEIGRSVLSETRDPSSVSRRMRRGSFRTRDMVRAEMKRQVTRELVRAGGRKELWFLPLDGLASKRGSLTKVENAIQYKKKRKGKKGRSTKAHLFVKGLLITGSGARIPLPRRSYYTKAYVASEKKKLKLHRRTGKPVVYKTQVDLACLIVKELKLPENIQLVVVTDEYFEGQKLANLCRKKGYVFIAPADSNRTFEPGKTLHARGKALSKGAYRTLVLRRGEEDTASPGTVRTILRNLTVVHRRHWPKGAGEKGRRVYRFHCERRAVAGIGEAAVVYSWKRRRDRSGRLTKRETFKALVCVNPELLGERDIGKLGAMIVESFEMRWPIEVFFRELKSDLGLSEYRGTDFRAFERHVDLCVLSFMFLEEMRREEAARTRSPVRRREVLAARTSGMLRRLRREALAGDVSYLRELEKLRKRAAQLEDLVPGLRIPA